MDSGTDTGPQPALDEGCSVCFVCRLQRAEPLIHLGRGISTFIDQCSAICRTDLVDYIQSNMDACYIHKSCKNDVYNKSVKAAKQSSISDSQASSRKRTRASSVAFDFKSLCLYCVKPTAECKREDWHCVETMEMRSTIMDAALSRPHDPWSLEIQGRLGYASDLVAAEARYHFECHRNFTTGRLHTPHKVRRGRPIRDMAQQVFQDLCDELLTHGENELFTLRELHDKMTQMARDQYGMRADDVYGLHHLRNKLKETFQDSIYFASRSGRTDVIGFRGLCDLILSNKYLFSRNIGEATEAEQVVMQAATLILAEIRETEYDRTFYPTADDIKGDGLRYIPPLLQVLLQRLINNPLKRTAMGQGIVQATKPNGCIMPVMFGLGVQIDRLGHRCLQDEMARLGFCMSNTETRRFKFSVMSNTDTDSCDDSVLQQSISFTQFVADNFDHNVRTLDGLGTFHGMGIISATVFNGGSFGLNAHMIRRCREMSVSDAIHDKCVPLEQFKRCGDAQLEDYVLCPLKELRSPTVEPDLLNMTNVWHICVFTGATKLRPNWPGFMQSVCTGTHPGACHIEFLSLVDQNPTDYNCVYSTLMYVSQQAKSLGLPVACVTFDQPLYIKAVDVTFKAQLDVVVRLGGFHTMMSFMGSLGHVMRGSGIEDVLLLLFGENTIEHVLSGKAYARAVRAHILIQAALVQLLLQYLSNTTATEVGTTQCVVLNDMPGQFSLTEVCLAEVETVYEQICSSGTSAFTECASLSAVAQQLELIKFALKEQCRTARLWITYIELVDVLRKFLIGERTGNWLLHLEALHDMLPLFSATGHANYARSARIYLQQMHMLPQTHPWLYEQFLRGNHVIRRSDRFWAGLSPDLCIEQTMMRSGKSEGGLTHGRGVTETVRTMWLSTLTECSAVHEAMMHLTDVEKHVAEHVETTDARMKRDKQDLDGLVKYFESYSPFRFNDTSRVISLATSIATSTDDGINCDTALTAGYVAQERWDGKRYGDVKLTKSDKAKTMSALTNKIRGSNVHTIDPHSLFHRLILVAERQQSVESCFAYELTPYPMALFKDSCLRKPDKPSLLRHVVKDLADDALPSIVQYVIDGGYLLHKVRWSPPADMQKILSSFHAYLYRFGTDVVVVFDGYSHGPSVKDQEHLRRKASCRSVATTRSLTEDTVRIGPQEPFLANISNKMGFIHVMKDFLERVGIRVVQAEEDADTEIVSVALQFATNPARPVAVVAEDTDILALLLFHRQPTMSEVFLCSEAGKTTGCTTSTGKCITSSSLQNKIASKACQRMLAVHAFGGCDGTCTIFGHEKGTIIF